MPKILGLTERQFERVANTVRRVDAMPQQQDPLSGPQAHFSERGVHWLNDSGEEIPDASIAVIDSYDVTTDNFPLAKLKKPYATFRNQLIITGPGPVEDDAVGFFPAGGLYRVRYDSGTPAFGEGWGPKPGQWTISKGFPGCVIEGILDATNKIALVSLLSPIVTLLGKASGSITARSGTTVGTGSMEIWYNNAGTLTDAGFSDITVKNLSASAVTSGGYIQAKWIGSDWFVDFEDCP